MKDNSASTKYMVALCFGMVMLGAGCQCSSKGLSEASGARPLQEDLMGLNFKATHVLQVLQIYSEATRLELIIASDVGRRAPDHIKLQPGHEVPRSEGIKLMEESLLQQAGIVITKLPGNRASVTYNDALPVVPLAESISTNVPRSDSDPTSNKPEIVTKPQ